MSGEDELAEAYERALSLEKAGDAGAAAAWAEVLRLNPDDPGGASVRLAALGAAPPPDKAPPAYVATLFDQHAEVFDGILVDQLEYGVPMLARERMQALGLGPFGAMLDLGCGTGLAAEALEDMCAEMTGVDLAEGMIEIADEKELYQRLYVAEAVNFLNAAEPVWDLIIATDVLPYLGDARPFFGAAAAKCAADGWLIFSTETMDDIPPPGWRVTPHHRFAHNPDWLDAELAAAGFELAERTEIMVRREEGAPIPGHLYLARRR